VKYLEAVEAISVRGLYGDGVDEIRKITVRTIRQLYTERGAGEWRTQRNPNNSNPPT
jgi:hypothetical protein